MSQQGETGQARDKQLIRTRVIAVAALAVVLLAGRALMSLLSQDSVAEPSAPTATPGPLMDFTVQNLAGEEVSLSHYRGQVVLVNFWATWCSPCRAEMPVLDAYYQEYRDRGFTLLGIDVSDRPEDAAAFFEGESYTYPLLFDPPGNVLIDLGARGLPISILVDAEGHRLQTWVGPLTRDLLDTQVTPLLADKPGD